MAAMLNQNAMNMMNSYQQMQQPGSSSTIAADRATRSVFVGNIPYEATEEQMKEIFCQAGTVVSFRLVYDRETGKPKGYGFCEYQDVETAQSAMRNLNNHDFNGRPLRVGIAAGEQSKDEVKTMQQATGGAPVESPYGEEVQPEKAPEAISKAVASLPPEQMFELMKQMKLCIQNNPTEARNMLLQNPQLAYALLQAQIVMKIVDPQVAMAMLHRTRQQIPPVTPSGAENNPQAGSAMDVPAGLLGHMGSQMQPAQMGMQMQPGPMQGGPMMAAPMQGYPGPNVGAPMGNRVPGPMQNAPIRGPSIVQGGPGAPNMGQSGPGMRGPGMPTMRGPMPMDQGMAPRHAMGQQDMNQMRGPFDAPSQIAGDPRSMTNRMAASQQPVTQQPSASTAPPVAAATTPDQEKAALIMQVLQLTDEQITMLPPEQRQSILVLKEQIAKGAQ